MGPAPVALSERLSPHLTGAVWSLGVRLEQLPQAASLSLVLSGVFTDVEASLKDIKDLLEEDELQEQKFQEAVGPAGASLAVSKAELAEVKREWTKYMEVHEKASFTNSELHRAMNLHVGNLRLLSGPLDLVRAALPSPALTAGEHCLSLGEGSLKAGCFSGLTDLCRPQRTRLCYRT